MLIYCQSQPPCRVTNSGIHFVKLVLRHQRRGVGGRRVLVARWRQRHPGPLSLFVLPLSSERQPGPPLPPDPLKTRSRHAGVNKLNKINKIGFSSPRGCRRPLVVTLSSRPSCAHHCITPPPPSPLSPLPCPISPPTHTQVGVADSAGAISTINKAGLDLVALLAHKQGGASVATIQSKGTGRMVSPDASQRMASDHEYDVSEMCL